MVTGITPKILSLTILQIDGLMKCNSLKKSSSNKLVLPARQLQPLTNMAHLLEPFYQITNMFSGSDYPTANLYFEQVCRIEYHLRKACESGDDHIRQMGNKMFEKFDKYWLDSSLLVFMAAVFDPRHKLAFLKHHYKQVLDTEEEVCKKIEMVRSELVNLFTHYKSRAQTSQPTSISISGSPIGSSYSSHSDDYQSFESSCELYGLDYISELNSYLDSNLERPVSPDFDILLYWKSRQATSPILASIAKDILAIPIMTVASESIFSMGGRILSKWRASLLSRHVEALVTTQNWLFGYEEPKEEGVIAGNDHIPDNVHEHGDDGPLSLDSE